MKKHKRILSLLLTVVMFITTFTSTAVIAHASMLPLEEIKAYLVLNDCSSDDLSMTIDEMLKMLEDSDGNPIKIADDATTVWKYVKDDASGLETYEAYQIGDVENKINLYPGDGIKTFQFEIIVGKNGQLDKSNKRYIITAYLDEVFEDDIQPVIYVQDENGARTEAVISNTNFWIYNYTSGAEELNFDLSFGYPKDLCNYGSVWLGFKSDLANDPRVEIKFHPVNIYSGGIHVPDYSTDITDKLLNLDMDQLNSGMQITGKMNTDYTYRMVTYVNGVEYSSKYVCVRYWAWYPCHTGKLYADSTKIESVTSSVQTDFNSKTDVSEITLELKPGYSDDSQYYFDYDFIMERGYWGNTGAQNYDSLVNKVYIGHYDTIDEAVADGAKEVTGSILNKGYLANYSGQGIDFTVFKHYRLSQSFPIAYDTLADKITVKVVKNPNQWREFTDKPIVGEADPWLRVTGVNGIDDSNVYVVENGKSINMDTYYGYGYQTIFIKDPNIDLSNISPRFEYADDDRVYAVSEDTGDIVDDSHKRDFTKENQQYTGRIDGNDRNYWVTFKKLNNNGPKLFVYGPTNREVILDEYFEHKHDILIANIGNAPLKDLSVELVNAENVKLDPYWTVGGNGNNTLDAFTTTSTDKQYGELPNVAKIRLLPDGDGEVKGTLVIRAENQKIEIELHGKAKNPEIITETLSDAVKYVPYQHIVATDNMHDWVDTKFKITEGALPNGVSLNSETGEIYGVPTVPAGNAEVKYDFTVEARFLVDGQDGYFEPAYAKLSIVVKPNTNVNVFEASDVNYGIKQVLGVDQSGTYDFVLSSTDDQVFTSYGEFNEFAKLWLNGEELIDGVDYTKEEGSTIITIKSQTFENKVNPDAPNTIAAEFRKDTNGDGKGDKDGEMKRTSQNFTVNKTDTAVTNVIDLIAKIPSNVTLDAKPTVQAARNAYNALNASQKKDVTNYSRLENAEKAIATLEVQANDKAKANEVIALINAIPTPVTLDRKNDVVKARNAYEMLTSAQKNYVEQSYLNKLKAAEDKIAELEAAEREEQKQQAEINEVISKINALPEQITLKDKGAVEATRKAYDALSAKQKDKVVNYDKLTAAENTIKALEALEEANAKDKAAANEVIKKIEALTEQITLDDKATVEAVRDAYNALTETQKQLVTNYNGLESAEDTIKTLEAYEEANKKDKEAADKVIALIDALPENITVSDKENIESVRNAYESLTEAQKAIVTNYDALVAAEVKLAEAEKNDYENNKETAKITFVGILTDKDGKPLSDYIVEIHSTVQVARTDKNGYFRFTNVEMGNHTLTIKDKDGNIVSTKEFKIVEGTPLSLKDDVITAEDGSVFTVNIKADGKKIVFVSVEEGDKTPDNSYVDDGSDESINIDIPSTSPNTGENTNLAFWYALLVSSLCVLAALGYYELRRKYNNNRKKVQ